MNDTPQGWSNTSEGTDQEALKAGFDPEWFAEMLDHIIEDDRDSLHARNFVLERGRTRQNQFTFLQNLGQGIVRRIKFSATKVGVTPCLRIESERGCNENGVWHEEASFTIPTIVWDMLRAHAVSDWAPGYAQFSFRPLDEQDGFGALMNFDEWNVT